MKRFLESSSSEEDGEEQGMEEDECGSPTLEQEVDLGRDGRPAPRGTLPAGRGGFPAPPRTVGRGGFPAPTRPVKMIKTAGKLRGKIKAYI